MKILSQLLGTLSLNPRKAPFEIGKSEFQCLSPLLLRVKLNPVENNKRKVNYHNRKKTLQ